MLTDKLISFAFIGIFIFERLLELSVNKINNAFMVNTYLAKIKYPKESMQMRLFHSFWFFALIIETSISGALLQGTSFFVVVLILILAQSLRWYSIYSLGPYWSVDIYEVKNHPIIESGPYKFLRHPNYLAVIIEFLFLPLLLGCFKTLIAGIIINAFILKRRIRLEEQSLIEQTLKA